MKNRMKQSNVISALCLSLAVLLFGGCSYREMEDNVKREVADLVQSGQEETPAEIPQTETTEAPVYGIGDTVVWTSVYGETMEHTVLEMRTGENLEEFGVSPEDCDSHAQGNFVGENGEALGGPLADENRHYIFIELRVKIKNIDFRGWEPQPDDYGQIAMETKLYTQEEKEDRDAMSPDKDCIWFDGHTDDIKRYYFCDLDPGEEMEAALLWVVSESALEEPLYYVIGSATGWESFQYILLNPETE